MTQLHEDRLWVDGCFDFTHHGHAGAMRQARKLGNELYVGIHTDEDIYVNKGPVVMNLDERVMAVEACKWCTKTIPGAPYVTDPAVMDQYGCKFVVHGDDITTDADGNDCYRIVKEQGRFVVVKRTPNISTTDLVQRMLTKSKNHHLSDSQINDLLKNEAARFKDYATDCDARSPHSGVYLWDNATKQVSCKIDPSEVVARKLARRAIYVDGGFDLFFKGHIEFLRLVSEWAKKEDPDAVIIVGLHDDDTVNAAKGSNYPIMNQFERSMCVLQCRYVDAIVLGAPFVPYREFRKALEVQADIHIAKVVHGPTPIQTDGGTKEEFPYTDCEEDGIYYQLPHHQYDDVTSTQIVERVLKYREQYEERQRKKGIKAQNEVQLEQEEKKNRSLK